MYAHRRIRLRGTVCGGVWAGSWSNLNLNAYLCKHAFNSADCTMLCRRNKQQMSNDTAAKLPVWCSRNSHIVLKSRNLNPCAWRRHPTFCCCVSLVLLEIKLKLEIYPMSAKELDFFSSELMFMHVYSWQRCSSKRGLCVSLRLLAQTLSEWLTLEEPQYH